MAEVVATTDRLALRTWDRADLDTFVRLTNTPAVMRWLGGVWSRDDHEAAFDRIETYQRSHGHTYWIIERKADGALLGFCGLKRVNSPGAGALTGDFEIGWRLREDVWGQSIAKEAAIASLDLAFGRFGAPHVVAITVPGNSASLALMQRLGMTPWPDRDYVDPRFADPGEFNPSVVSRIAADDWPAARVAALS